MTKLLLFLNYTIIPNSELTVRTNDHDLISAPTTVCGETKHIETKKKIYIYLVCTSV